MIDRGAGGVFAFASYLGLGPGVGPGVGCGYGVIGPFGPDGRGP